MREEITLGSLCRSPACQIQLSPEDIIDYIDISSVSNETKSITSYSSMSFSEAPSRARKAIREKSILVSTVRPNLNAIAVFDKRTPNTPVASTGFSVLDCKENVDHRFIYHYCKSPRFINQMISQATGASYPAVNDGIVRSALIPNYSFDEQKKISNLLDKTETIINSRKNELHALDTLIKARFVEMFDAYNADCCSKRIGEYAQVLGGYAFKSNEFIQDAIPVIRISNINEGKIIPDHAVCFSEQFWSDNPKFRAVAGDILMAMSGATTGKAGILRSDVRLLINQRVACIRAKEGISLPEFLYAVTQLPWMYDLIQEKSAGCAQPNISGKQIENMPIPEATYMQQKEFASFVSQVDKSKVVVQTALDKTQLLFDSLMQQYFG